MKTNREKTTNSKKMNLIFALVVLALAAVLAVLGLANRKDPHELCALVLYDNEEGSQQMVISLDEDKTYDIPTRFDTVHIQVKDGAVAFINSPCPDHVCEGFGWLNSRGAFASCIPNGVFMSIEEIGDVQ